MSYLDWLAQRDLESCTFKEAFQAGAASRDAEVARLKTVPMRYRRMAFNAQLQDEVARLEQENDQLRAAIQEFIARVDRGEVHSTRTYNKFKELLK